MHHFVVKTLGFIIGVVEGVAWQARPDIFKLNLSGEDFRIILREELLHIYICINCSWMEATLILESRKWSRLNERR